MSNIIKLLPDSIANQIAAGEVIQRPASVVKELTENAVDAGSTSIKIVVKDAGRSLIQVIDNGSGMSEMDARMSFDRHATSKIVQAEDLFAIQTKGFRGEALASIAAVAQVELRTRHEDDELGTLIEIAGSRFENQETISCPKGTNFIIKNLFFNIPARRKFLKKNSTEFRHIINEFERIALAHPDVELTLNHNDSIIFNLPSGNFRQRIISIAGKHLNNSLVPINTETELVKITGFIGKPEAARKTIGDQFFFVNHRFIRHPYLHKSITEGYDNLISSDSIPIYYINMEVDPQTIDINIHPTKTEIKFEDERTIWHILNASIRETLGKFNIVPSINFDTEGLIDIPINPIPDQDGYSEPQISVNPEFNPFEINSFDKSPRQQGSGQSNQGHSVKGWEQLYDGFETETFSSKMYQHNDDETETPVIQQHILPSANEHTINNNSKFYQFKNRYILTSVKSGLMMIDQKRAHERILFERFLSQMEQHRSASQKMLFPEILTFNSEDALLLSELTDDLRTVGIDIDENEDGDFEIAGLPSDLEGVEIRKMLEAIIENHKNSESDVVMASKEKIAQTLAKKAAIAYGKQLNSLEMQELFDQLFACSSPNYAPDGKSIIAIMNNENIDQLF